MNETELDFVPVQQWLAGRPVNLSLDFNRAAAPGAHLQFTRERTENEAIHRETPDGRAD